MDITLKDLHINYSVTGEGRNIVLLHGWGADITLYAGMIKALSAYSKVYALDMPGVGKSDEPPCAWSVDDYTDLVTDFIKAMGIKKADLIGHSFGGRVITKLMNRPQLPCEVDKIVFIDTAGIKPKKKLKTRLKVRKYKIAKKLFANRLMNYLYPDYVENMRKKTGSSDYNSATPVMRATLVKVVNEDLTPLLFGIKRPVLLIWGENDNVTPLSDAQLMEKLIPDSGLYVVKGAGHFSFLERPGEVYAALNNYFSA